MNRSRPGALDAPLNPRRTACVELLWRSAPILEDAAARALASRRSRLLRALEKAGIRGWPEQMTLYTRSLPPGCRKCLKGLGTHASMTYLCTRECFFCPNPHPRQDELRLGGEPVPGGAAGVVRYMRKHRLSALAIGGGEPLLTPERTLGLIARARRGLGAGPTLHLYTNGDLANDELLGRLKAAGLDEIRFNLVANGFDLKPVRRALAHFKNVVVEIPVVPEMKERLKRLILELDRLGVPYLNLNEMFYDGNNQKILEGRGYAVKPSAPAVYTLRKAVGGSGETALELLLFALKRAKTLSVYHCSWSTWENFIGPRSWARRRRGRPG